MNKKYNLFIKKLIFILLIFGSFPCTYFLSLSNGLDQSWIFALNYIQQSNLKFGEDHFFTYGPLGFLARCQFVGNNLYIGILFWIIIAIIQSYLFFYLIKKTHNLKQIVIASVLVILALPISEADMLLSFLSVMSLLIIYKYDDSYSKVILFGLSGVIFLFKFSGTILLIATLFVSIICAFADKKQAKIIWMFLSCMVIGPICYLFYNPSIHSLIKYVRAAIEISLGYNTSMSLDIYRAYYIWVIVLVVCFVTLLIFGYIMKKKQWNYFLILAPSSFFWYKEGFVRNDGHYVLAISGMLLVCSLLIFFVDFDQWFIHIKENYILKAMLCILCVMVIIPVMGNGKTLSGSLQASASNIFNLPKLIDDCRMQDRNLLQEHNKVFMEIIGEQNYSTFPWEITENISYSNQNFQIAPLLQNYTVYTPYLDRLNAKFYEGEDSPEYIILYLNTIDGRLPLIETPATWEKIYKNYCLLTTDEEKFLLKKREQPISKEISKIDEKNYKTGESIEIPESCSFIKIDAKLGIKGRLQNLFYKILPVNLKITYTDGTVKEGRVVVDNLSEGIDLNSIILDRTDFVNYMNLNVGNKNVTDIFLTGPGVKQYDSNIKVTFFSGSWKE